jgi:hypothetical protein
VRLFLDICQGLGLGAAAGIRPFLPAVVAGGLATADLGVDFDHTGYAFLEAPVWLVAMAAALVVSVLVRRRGGTDALDAALGGVAVGLGALLFAATLADHGHSGAAATALGLLGGAGAALLGQATARDLATRTARRLDTAARAALPVYFECVAAALAALSVALPPVSLVALPFLGWLLRGGRRREGGKYAGLRILR